MKYSAFVLLAMIATGCLRAQNCNNYLLLQNNKKVEMTVYNKKGKENGKQVWQVSNVQKAGSTVTATVNSEFFNEKGKSLNKGLNQIKCTGGVFFMNLKMMLSEQQANQMGDAEVKAEGEFLEYPATLKESDDLKDGNLKMDFTMKSGMKAAVELEVTQRKVVGKESITSPAGTWDCFKITSHQKVTSRIAGVGIPFKMDVTEWFAPGVGVIKTESKYGTTLVTLIQ